MNCRKRKQGCEPKFCWFGKENLIHHSPRMRLWTWNRREIASESNIYVKKSAARLYNTFVMYFSDRMWEMILQKVDLPTSCFLFLQLNCRFNCRFFLQLDCRFRNPRKKTMVDNVSDILVTGYWFCSADRIRGQSAQRN